MRRHGEDCFWLDSEDNHLGMLAALEACKNHDNVGDESWFCAMAGFMATVVGSHATLSTWTVADALVHAKLCASKGEATRKLKEGAVKINGKQVKANRLLQSDDIAFSRFSLLGIGKSTRALLIWASEQQMTRLETLMWMQEMKEK